MDYRPLSLTGIKTYSLKERPSKVKLGDLAKPLPENPTLQQFFACLPDILAARQIKELARAVVKARRRERAVIWAMGAHVIKCGLSPLLIQLMEKGIISALAMNGAGIIHDFELAYAGRTSEDVPAQLREGRFGMARETGEQINEAIRRGAAKGLGMGAALGEYLLQTSPPHLDYSLAAQARRRKIPLTVHVAIGTDITHLHPQVDAAAIGESSHLDFRLLAAVAARMQGGGVFINAGSAVIMPEVFLKALTLVRNLGFPLTDFSTANLDFKSHYRPLQNVVRRPTGQGGRGFNLIGHHELLIPLLVGAILQEVQG